MRLLLTKDDLIKELMTGGFGPMSKNDWDCWAGADEGTLIAFPKRGSEQYAVLFSPKVGEFEIYPNGETTDLGHNCWVINGLNGEVQER